MMVRLFWTRIATVVSLLSLLVSVSYLLLWSSAPPPLRYRGRPGLLQGYRDCHPAQQFVLVHTNTHTDNDTALAVVEQILENFALKHQLQTGRKSTTNCTIFFVGIDEHSVNCSNLSGLRESIGEETYIVSMSNRSVAKLTGADFNFIIKVFKQSLLVLRHLLCMELRDIMFDDSISPSETTDQDGEDDFQNIISYVGQDIIKRQMKVFNDILKKAKTKSNEHDKSEQKQLS